MCYRVCELIQLLHSCSERTTRYGAIEQLGQIGIGREDAIDALISVVRLTTDEPTRWLAIENLSQIAIGHSTAIDTLIEILPTSRPPTKELFAKYLPPMLGNNSSAITSLANIARTESDETTLRAVAAILGKVNTNKSAAIGTLIHLAYNTSNSYTLMRVINSLTWLKANTNDAIFVYLYLIKNKADDDIRTAAISALQKIVLEEQIIELISVLQQRYIFCMAGVTILMGLLSCIKLPAQIMSRIMRGFHNVAEQIVRKIILHFMSQIKVLQEKLRIGENILECYLVATVLGETGLATNKMLDNVLEIIHKEQHTAFRTLGYYSLARMTISNLATQEKLIEIMSTAKDEEERQDIAFALREAEKLKTQRLEINGEL